MTQTVEDGVRSGVRGYSQARSGRSIRRRPLVLADAVGLAAATASGSRAAARSGWLRGGSPVNVRVLFLRRPQPSLNMLEEALVAELGVRAGRCELSFDRRPGASPAVLPAVRGSAPRSSRSGSSGRSSTPGFVGLALALRPPCAALRRLTSGSSGQRRPCVARRRLPAAADRGRRHHQRRTLAVVDAALVAASQPEALQDVREDLGVEQMLVVVVVLRRCADVPAQPITQRHAERGGQGNAAAICAWT